MSANIVGKYRGRDWLTIQEWSQEELQTLIDAAIEIKKLQKARKPHDYLLRQTLLSSTVAPLFVLTLTPLMVNLISSVI